MQRHNFVLHHVILHPNRLYNRLHRLQPVACEMRVAQNNPTAILDRLVDLFLSIRALAAAERHEPALDLNVLWDEAGALGEGDQRVRRIGVGRQQNERWNRRDRIPAHVDQLRRFHVDKLRSNSCLHVVLNAN